MTALPTRNDSATLPRSSDAAAAADASPLHRLVQQRLSLPEDCASPCERRLRQTDWLIATPDRPHRPRCVFERLHWGGQFVFVAHDHRRVVALSRLYHRKGFTIEQPIGTIGRRCLGIPLGRRAYFFVARKTAMVQPGHYSDRFTYDVQLERLPGGDEYVVVKKVPTMEDLLRRLESRTREAKSARLIKHARQLHDTIFPVFLTREAAFLKILQRDLPEPFRRRVPRIVKLERDDRGYVQRLELNWMRRAAERMSHIDFAVQAAELLQQLHERARVIHLDLRLDNFVITDDGVGFVDYGSAARVGENLAASPLLSNLFGHIMRTSQIQRMLDHMAGTGAVTSELITNSRQKVDKAIDLFYLAVQIERPDTNPYTRELVRYEPRSREAALISDLCAQVLRPGDPKRPAYSSIREVVAALHEIREQCV